MKIKHLIDILLTPEITALPYVDRYGGIVKTMHLIVDDGTETGAKKKYPVACDVVGKDCDNTGIYQDLVPNDSRKSVSYWEEVTPMKNVGFSTTQRDFYNKRFKGVARFVFWANLSQLGIDNCNDLFFAIPEFEKIFTKKGVIDVGDYQGFNYWIQPIGMVKNDPDTVFGKYTYPKENQYYLFPNDFFAIDVQFELNQCLKKGGLFPDLPPILCPNGAFDRCTYITDYIGNGEGSLKLDCVLPTYDFADEDTQNAVTGQQQTDLIDWLCVAPPEANYKMALNGINQFIYTPTNVALDFEYNTAFSGVVRSNVANLQTCNLVNKLSIGINPRGWFFIMLSDGRLRFDLQHDGTVTWNSVTTVNPVVTTGVDEVYGFSKDLTTNISGMKIYVNGVSVPVVKTAVNSDTLGSNTIVDSSVEVYYGINHKLISAFNGELDESLLWNTELSAAEFLTESNRDINTLTIPPKPANVVCRCRMGEGALYGVSDWVFPDESGTLTGLQSTNCTPSSRVLA